MGSWVEIGEGELLGSASPSRAVGEKCIDSQADLLGRTMALPPE